MQKNVDSKSIYKVKYDVQLLCVWSAVGEIFRTHVKNKRENNCLGGKKNVYGLAGHQHSGYVFIRRYIVELFLFCIFSWFVGVDYESSPAMVNIAHTAHRREGFEITNNISLIFFPFFSMRLFVMGNDKMVLVNTAINLLVRFVSVLNFKLSFILRRKCRHHTQLILLLHRHILPHHESQSKSLQRINFTFS